MAGKLQNEDFKTEAELTGAGGSKTQLLNDTKVYVTSGGINKTLDDAITDGDIGGGGGGFPTLFIKDVRTSGTQGGSFTSGSYFTRTLNTSSGDTSFLVSLSSNQFVLDAGTYIISCSAPCSEVNTNKTKLRNVTDATNLIIGTTSKTSVAEALINRSFINGEFTVAAGKSLEIQHRCSTTKATTGFGRAASYGDSEIYTELSITKIG